MQLKNILTQHRCACGVESLSKKRTLQILSELIAEDLPDLSADDIFTSMTARERLGSTGIGNGIAIPHCRVKTCSNTVGALLHLEKGIDFDAIDEKPVDLVFALLVPDEAHDAHLQTLASLVERLNDNGYLNSLRAAPDCETLYSAAISLD